VELPDGVCFEQYVMRIPVAAMCLLVDDRNRVLMLRRHRFILDRWVWELPGGYIEDGEDPAECAAREGAEETGWRPGKVEHLVTFQPMAGMADAENHLYLGRGVEYVGEPDVNEPGEVAWIELQDLPGMIVDGGVAGAASVGARVSGAVMRLPRGGRGRRLGAAEDLLGSGRRHAHHGA